MYEVQRAMDELVQKASEEMHFSPGVKGIVWIWVDDVWMF